MTTVQVVMLAALIASSLAITLFMGKLWLYQKQNLLLDQRLKEVDHALSKDRSDPAAVLRRTAASAAEELGLPGFADSSVEAYRLLLGQAGLLQYIKPISVALAAFMLLPLGLAVLFPINALAMFVLSVGLVALCVSGLYGRRSAIRKKFMLQLPDAVDLIISILKSGHGVSTAISTVGREVASPCGPEFAEVAARVNLGVQLADALQNSALKYDSDDLELIAKAVAIHSEVGGSLSELLEKTNSTLRQRLKLARQAIVLSSQSRLTATIASVMPFLLGAGLIISKPDYLQPLLESPVGMNLLVLAGVLWFGGVVILNRLTAMKV